MPILATIAAGFASFVLGVLACMKLNDLLESRWSDKRIDVIFAILCGSLTGTSAYVMAMFGPISFTSAALIHLGVGIFFALIVATGFMNYIEAFILATILCILCTVMIPTVTVFRELHRETSIHRSPDMVFTQMPYGYSCDVVLASHTINFNSTQMQRPLIQPIRSPTVGRHGFFGAN